MTTSFPELAVNPKLPELIAEQIGEHERRAVERGAVIDPIG